MLKLLRKIVGWSKYSTEAAGKPGLGLDPKSNLC